jgi:hypothetical protein
MQEIADISGQDGPVRLAAAETAEGKEMLNRLCGVPERLKGVTSKGDAVISMERIGAVSGE